MPTKVRECPGQEVENGSWREDGEIRTKLKKFKLSEMGALNMKQKTETNLVKVKRFCCSPVAFKHGCLLKTSGDLAKKAIPGHLYFSDNSKIILMCIWVSECIFAFQGEGFGC